MSDTSKPDFRKSINELLEAHPELCADGSSGPHPKHEDAAEKELAEEDLSADDLLQEWQASIASVDEDELDAAWENFSDALPASRRERPDSLVRLPWAAMLAVACLGLTVWALQLRTANIELSKAASPAASVEILDLVSPSSRGSIATGEEPTKIWQVSGSAEVLVLLLEPEDKSPYDRYGLKVANVDGRTLIDLADVQKNEYGSLQVALRRASLPESRVSVELWAEAGAEVGAERKVLARYELQLNPQTPGD